MKLQISIEFLFLFTIAIISLAVTFYSFNSLSKSSSYSIGRAFFIRESSFFYELTKDVCSTGDGNVRKVEFPYVFEVHYDEINNIVDLNSSYGNMSYPLSCKVEDSIVQGKVAIMNNKGVIIIQPSS